MSNFANRFALLDDDAPTEPASKPVAPSQPPKPATESPTKPARGGGGDRGGRGAPRGAPATAAAPAARNGPTTTTQRSVTADGPDGDLPSRDDRSVTRGRGRGARGGTRATGGGRGRGGPRGERPDRHSATNKEDSDKKDHQGWGGDEGKRELDDEDRGKADALDEKGLQTPTKAATTAAADDDWGALAETAPPPSKTDDTLHKADAAPVEVEPEEVTKSYEEYLAERANELKVGADFVPRKANEGADETQWSSGVPLTAKGGEETDFFVGKQAASRARKPREDKRTRLEPDITFTTPREDRPSRGGRGGGRGGPRGGGDRGGFRGSSFRGGRGGAGGDQRRADFGRGPLTQHQPNVTDEIDFPSL